MKGEHGGIRGEDGNTNYRGMVQSSRQHVASCVKRRCVRIGHDRFEKSGSVLNRHSVSST